MDSAALTAYELITIVAIGATLAGLRVGYAWGCKTTRRTELISEEEIPQLFPAPDPLTWDHLSVPVEQEQQL